MHELKPGVRIYVEHEGRDDRERVLLSDGGEHLSGVVVGDIPFIPEAVAPSRSWRLPTRDELSLLRCEAEDAKPGQTVSVVRIADDLVGSLRRLPRGDDVLLGGGSYPLEAGEALLGRVADALAPFLEAPEDLVIYGIHVQRGGLRLATSHNFGKREVFLGMHVDRWHQGPHGCETHAQMSINIGTSDRHFAFLNLPVTELAKSFGDELGGWLTIGRDFVRSHARYPIVRVRVRPGEAFIAPTENLVHDLNLEATDVDVTFNVRGRLRPVPLAE